MGHFTSIKIHSVKKYKCFYTSTFKSFCTFSFCPYSIISLFFYFFLSSPLISDIFITSHLHSKCLLLVVSKIFHHFVFHFTCLTVIFPITVFFSPKPNLQHEVLILLKIFFNSSPLSSWSSYFYLLQETPFIFLYNPFFYNLFCYLFLLFLFFFIGLIY